MRNKWLLFVVLAGLMLSSSEFSFAQVGSKEKSINIQWNEMGPINYGGRTRAILIDKNNANKIFIGGIASGLWMSEYGGSSWKKVTNSDLANNIAVSCLYQAPSGEMYYGTGEYFGFDNTPGVAGNGIWKSTDGGNTWTQLSSTDNNETFRYVTKLAGYSNKIYAATYKGLRISNDGGQTWTNPIPSSDSNYEMPATDVKVSSDGSVIVASINNKAYVCNTGDDNFVLKTDIASDVIRLEFAIAPSNSNHIYCLAVAQDGRLKNIYESTDKGNTWNAIISNVTSQFQPFGQAKNKQGKYHCSIAVDPLNESKIYIGGVDLYYYTPLENFVQISFSQVPAYMTSYVHENIHNIVFSPDYSTNNTFYVATDGGVFRTTNGGYSWVWLNKEYAAMDFLNVAITNNNEVIGGTVHNGIMLNNLQGNTQQHFFKYLSGTVGCVQRSSVNPNFMISSTTYGKTYRTYQGASQFTNAYVIDSIPSTGSYPQNIGTYKEPYLAQLRLHEKFYDPNSTNYIIYQAPRKLRLGDTIFTYNRYEKILYHIISAADLNGDTVINKDDTVYVKDYYQILTAFGLNNRLWISWNALDPSTSPSWYPILYSTSIKRIQTLEFTADGNIIYFADYDSTTNKSTVYRVDSIQAARTRNLAVYNSPNCVVTYQKLGTFDGKVQSLGIDPQNNENLLVTIGDYSNGSHVYYSTNAASTTNDTMEVNFVSKQGNLPIMPVYASVIIWNNSQQVMIGTDKGVWFTEDITASSPTWVQQIDGMANVPVSDLRQQIHPNGWIPNNNVVFGGIQTDVTNHGVIYAATRGRGIFRCENFRGPVHVPTNNLETRNMFSVYPNPAETTISIQFSQLSNSNVEVNIWNVSGQLIEQKSFNNINSGQQILELPVYHLQNGIYFITVKSAEKVQYGKFIKQ